MRARRGCSGPQLSCSGPRRLQSSAVEHRYTGRRKLAFYGLLFRLENGRYIFGKAGRRRKGLKIMLREVPEESENLTVYWAGFTYRRPTISYSPLATRAMASV